MYYFIIFLCYISPYFIFLLSFYLTQQLETTTSPTIHTKHILEPRITISHVLSGPKNSFLDPKTFLNVSDAIEKVLSNRRLTKRKKPAEGNRKSVRNSNQLNSSSEKRSKKILQDPFTPSNTAKLRLLSRKLRDAIRKRVRPSRLTRINRLMKMN